MQDYRRFDKKVDTLLDSLSIKEKIGQLKQVNYTYLNYDAVAEEIKNRRAGSIIIAASAQAGNDELTKANHDSVFKLQMLAMENGGIPIIVGRDVIHGHKTVYPIPLAMAASFNTELVKKCYANTANEIVNEGVRWSFAPMADVSRDPRWGRAIEGQGEDPYLGAKMARAAIEGFQGEDLSEPTSVAACIKHFIGYGASEGGRDYNSTEIGENSLRNYYLRAFDEAVKAGVATVMTSLNAISGVPVSVDEYLIRDVLKNELGFDGFVVSDWASVRRPFLPFGAADSEKEAARLCLNAGIDMEMVTNCYLDNAEALINEGKLSIDVLDDAVRRILRVKMALGLFENYKQPNVSVDYDAHLKDAVAMAQESIVLLKNNNNLLPLRRDKEIAVVGPMLHQKRNFLGSWTTDIDLSCVKSYKEVLDTDFADVKISYNDTELYDSMLRAARDVDTVVVLLGESAAVTGENRSLASADVPSVQAELVKSIKMLGKKVVAVLNFGRVVAMGDIEPYCDAILYAWHNGTGTAPALVNTLFGINVPSGALPMTMLRRTEQVPLYYNAPRCGVDVDAYFDVSWWAHGYEDMLKTPLYPFGYGLSYTTFVYSDMKITKSVSYDELLQGGKLQVSVNVTNSGDYDGCEIVQCYIYDEFARIAKPLRELKGFTKVFIKMGETKTVVFELGLDELGYYDCKNCFGTDKGLFKIYIGKGAFTDNVVDFVLE